MNFENLTGKQFRGVRTRAGKLVSNRIGGYERPRREDYEFEPRRQKRLLDALACEERGAVDELVVRDEKICPYTGLEIPVGGGLVIDEPDSFEQDKVMVVRFNADGSIFSAGFVGFDEALALQGELSLS